MGLLTSTALVLAIAFAPVRSTPPGRQPLPADFAFRAHILTSAPTLQLTLSNAQHTHRISHNVFRHRRQSVPTKLPGNWTSLGCYMYVTLRNLVFSPLLLSRPRFRFSVFFTSFPVLPSSLLELIEPKLTLILHTVITLELVVLSMPPPQRAVL